MGNSFKEKVLISIKAFDRYSVVMKKTSELIRNFYMKIAENAYLAKIGKLPGSIKTKRLRKKRKAMVLKWYHRDRDLNRAR